MLILITILILILILVLVLILTNRNPNTNTNTNTNFKYCTETPHNKKKKQIPASRFSFALVLHAFPLHHLSRFLSDGQHEHFSCLIQIATDILMHIYIYI